MSDDFDQKLVVGGSQVTVGMATGNPLKIGEGLLTILGLETNNSATQKLVVADFEAFLGEELDARRAESAEHKRRLDTFEQRLITVNWLVEEFERRLSKQGARPSDLVALLSASFEVWKKTADDKKRKLLGNALRNAFDPKQYEEGLTLRLLGILAQLDYGDIITLRGLKEHEAFRLNGNIDITAADAQRPAVLIRAHSIPQQSLLANHLKRLSEHGLVWQLTRIFVEVPEQFRQGVEVNEPTELGARLLKLVADRESTSPAT